MPNSPSARSWMVVFPILRVPNERAPVDTTRLPLELTSASRMVRSSWAAPAEPLFHAPLPVSSPPHTVPMEQHVVTQPHAAEHQHAATAMHLVAAGITQRKRHVKLRYGSLTEHTHGLGGGVTSYADGAHTGAYKVTQYRR